MHRIQPQEAAPFRAKSWSYLNNMAGASYHGGSKFEEGEE